jgi:hypothetical protein
MKLETAFRTGAKVDRVDDQDMSLAKDRGTHLVLHAGGNQAAELRLPGYPFADCWTSASSAALQPFDPDQGFVGHDG